jgi:hypothetical protein
MENIMTKEEIKADFQNNFMAFNNALAALVRLGFNVWAAEQYLYAE